MAVKRVCAAILRGIAASWREIDHESASRAKCAPSRTTLWPPSIDAVDARAAGEDPDVEISVVAARRAKSVRKVTISASAPTSKPDGERPKARAPPRQAPSNNARPVETPGVARTFRARRNKRWPYSNSRSSSDERDLHIRIRADAEMAALTDEVRRVENTVAEIGLGDRAKARDGAAAASRRVSSGVMCVA